MKRNHLIHTCLVAVVSVLFAACKPEVQEAPRARFTYEVTDLAVKFTNSSTNATKYAWSFGDGKTSTEENPTHTYAENGNYEVELTATNASGQSHSRKESIKVEAASRVKITLDGNFGDWAEVPAEYLFTTVLEEDSTNYKVLKELKFCADDTYIYMYLKLDTMHNNALDIYLNIDGDEKNGYSGAWMWDQPKADYLMQGFRTDGYDMRLAKYDESKNGDWGWLQPNIAEVGSGLITLSTIKQISGTLMEFEAKIVREFIPGLGDEVRMGVYSAGTQAGGAWDTSGSLPSAKFTAFKNPMLNVKLK